MTEVANGPAPTRRAQTYADGDWHRLHPLTPVLRGGLAVAAIAGVFLATVWDQALSAVSNYLVYQEFPDTEIGELPPLPFGGSLLVGTALIVLVAALGAGWLWLTWFMHTVRIDDDVIEVRDGVLFRTHRRARRDRINSVAIWRPLIPRLLGVSKLEFQAAGSDANVSLSYLAYPVATELRRIVVQSEHTHAEPSQSQPNQSQHSQNMNGAADTDGGNYSLVGDSADDAAVVSGESDHREPDVIRHVEVPFGRLLGSLIVSLETFWFVTVFAVIIVGFAITGDLEWWIGAFPAALVYVVSIARGWTRASQFRLETVGESVRVSYGLLSTTAASIPPDKVHALHISQPWPWRLFGWWRVEIHRAITPGQSETNQGPSHQMVLPVGRLDDVRSVAKLFVHEALGDRGLAAIEAAATGSLADTRSADNTSFDRDTAGRGGLDDVIIRPGRLARLRLILSFPIHSIGIIEGALWLRTGVLVRKLGIVPLRRIQSAARFRGPWHAITGLDGLECNIVPGPGVTRMVGFEKSDARPFLETLSTRIVRAIEHNRETSTGHLTPPRPSTVSPTALSTAATTQQIGHES